MTKHDETEDGREGSGRTAASRTVSQNDQIVPGAEGEAGKRLSPPRRVERKTTLHSPGIGACRETKNTARKRTGRDLASPDPEIPYAKTKEAVRNRVCSIMEREDRMNGSIFLRLDDGEDDPRNLREGREQR
jgi:hypothetical protein